MSSIPKTSPFHFFNAISSRSSEADLEKKFIIPLLRLLGYDRQDWRSQVSINNLKLDFLIHPPTAIVRHPPFLVIEVKAPSYKINHHVWQINGYLRESKAVFGLLTNGYHFKLLYHFKGEILTIADYNQETLINNFPNFKKILSKRTCLAFCQKIYQNQMTIHRQLGILVGKTVNNQQLVNILQPTKPSDQEKKAMIITVFNNKGGVGKTTMTINLAAALTRLGKRVLLIDIDAQANLTTGLGIDPLNDIELQGKKDITHLLTDPKLTLKEVIYAKRWGNLRLDIIPSHIRLSDMETEINNLVRRDIVLAQKLENRNYSYQEDYDFVLIDPPPSFSIVNTISLVASNAILIPTQLNPYPIRALEYVIKRSIAVEEAKGDPLPILGIAVAMYDRKSSKHNLEMTEEIEKIIQKSKSDKKIQLFPEKTWIPNLNIVSTVSSFTKEYPLCNAEFDQDLTTRQKEAAQDAFDCYLNLAQHLINLI
jgi:cellulose biosynthesis protein BcsQ